MTRLKLSPDRQIIDNRERCPTCNMIEPRHKRWCITPMIQGEAIMETREVEGNQSIALKEKFPDEI